MFDQIVHDIEAPPFGLWCQFCGPRNIAFQPTRRSRPKRSAAPPTHEAAASGRSEPARLLQWWGTTLKVGGDFWGLSF